MSRAVLVSCLLIAGVACASPTDSSGPPPVVLLGGWNYVSTQLSPTSASQTGTLTVTSQSGHLLGGELTVSQTDSSGTHALPTAAVSGQALDSTHLDFDVFFTSNARRHVGTVKGDSIIGTWLEQSGTVTGTFRAARQVGP